MTRKPSESLDIEVRQIGQAAVVWVHGSTGMVEAQKLTDELLRLAQRAVPVIVLDLSDMEYISSAGLGAILRARKALREYKGEVRLVHPQPLIRILLETTRLTQLLPLFSTVEDALAGVMPPRL